MATDDKAVKAAEDQFAARAAALTPKTLTMAALRGLLVARSQAISAAITPSVPTPPPAPSPVAPTTPPTSITATLVDTTLTMNCMLPSGLVSGVDTYVDGVKLDWSNVKPDKTSVVGPAAYGVSFTVPADATAVAVAAYNDFGEGKMSAPQLIVRPPAPSPSPSPTPAPTGALALGLPGVYSYDQRYDTWLGLVKKLMLPTSTPSNPVMSVLHLARDKGWDETETIAFGPLGWGPSGRSVRKVITIPGWPDAVAGSHAAVVHGDFDSHYVTIFSKLAALFPDEELWYRVEHEANCCYNHKAILDPTNYPKSFDHISAIAKRISPTCKTIYCPIFGDADMPYESTEPKTMDGYGLDYYVNNTWQDDVARSRGIAFMCERSLALNLPLGPGLYEFGPGTWKGDEAGLTCPDVAQIILNVYNAAATWHMNVVHYVDDTSNSGGVDSDVTKRPVMFKTVTLTFGTATPHVDPIRVG